MEGTPVIVCAVVPVKPSVEPEEAVNVPLFTTLPVTFTVPAELMVRPAPELMVRFFVLPVAPAPTTGFDATLAIVTSSVAAGTIDGDQLAAVLQSDPAEPFQVFAHGDTVTGTVAVLPAHVVSGVTEITPEAVPNSTPIDRVDEPLLIVEPDGSFQS